MRGEIVWTFVFDTGGEIDLPRVRDVVRSAPALEAVQSRIAMPRNVEFPRPLAVPLDPVTRPTAHGPRTFEASARIYAIGAVAVTLRTRVEARDFGELRDLANLRVTAEGREDGLRALAERLFLDVHGSLGHAVVEPYELPMAPESYVVHCIVDPPMPVESLLLKERRAMAALLAGEADPVRLGPEEVEDNLRYWYRYYEDDLVIVDWDNALIVEPTGRYEDTLFLMELANVQLLELRTYDAYLDRVLERTYADLERFHRPGGIFRSARGLQEELSSIRIDLIRVSEEIDNIGKVFGDWYLAKLWLGLTQRFHLAEWQAALDAKLRALNDVYTLASHEVEHRRAILLEGAIVLLFVLDLVLLVATAL